MRWRGLERQSILPTIFVISAAENARSVSVRTLPSALRLRLSDIAAASSGASRTVTTSYRPCVQTISFTVTPAGGNWITTTPDGYFEGSANLAAFVRWNVDGVLYPAATYWDVYYRPDLVQQALRIPGG